MKLLNIIATHHLNLMKLMLEEIRMTNCLYFKVRTRLGADAKYRLTLEELQLFANQLETLPAKVTGHDGVAELLDNVASFQREAGRLLGRDSVEVEDIDKCLEKGEGLEIDLVELGQLKARSDQVLANLWQETLQGGQN